jgi:hypothetical protein
VNGGTQDLAGLDRALRRLHWSALATVAACALVALLQPGGDEPPPDRTLATAGIALAVATILARMFASSPVMRPRPRFVLVLVHLLCALALGFLGAYLAVSLDEKRVGAGFAVGGGILCLRPPPRLARDDAPAP